MPPAPELPAITAARAAGPVSAPVLVAAAPASLRRGTHRLQRRLGRVPRHAAPTPAPSPVAGRRHSQMGQAHQQFMAQAALHRLLTLRHQGPPQSADQRRVQPNRRSGPSGFRGPGGFCGPGTLFAPTVAPPPAARAPTPRPTPAPQLLASFRPPLRVPQPPAPRQSLLLHPHPKRRPRLRHRRPPRAFRSPRSVSPPV